MSRPVVTLVAIGTVSGVRPAAARITPARQRHVRTAFARLSLLAVLLTVLLLPAPALAQTTQVVEYYHTDALGSVRAVTNQSGVVIRRHDFLPFGEELQSTVPPPDKPLFTGKERDAETGLDYFGARYQRAGIGRFTSVDPVMTFDKSLADPQRWNRYAYARTNPLRWIDPDGRQIEAVYDRKNGTLTITDLDSGKQITIRVESGGKPWGEPIPNGSWDVVERRGRDDFFRLDRQDAHPYDDKDEIADRSKLRLHRPGRTVGCIAAKDWDEWKKANALILGTKTTVVPDNSVPFWHLRSETLVRYGTLVVR